MASKRSRKTTRRKTTRKKTTRKKTTRRKTTRKKTTRRKTTRKKTTRIKMTIKSKTYKMIAKKLSDEEKENLWPIIIKAGPFYDDYQKNTTRNIPVFLCSKE